MDNGCYNRPYDDQTQLRISLETQEKLYIQDNIKNNKFELVTSYILLYENSENPYEMRKRSILEFIQNNSCIHIDYDRAEEVKSEAESIMKTGIKMKDAYHVACAVMAASDYFITTDKRLLKYKSSKIQLLNPIDFIEEMEGV
ncbi:MAG: hypothetical protein LUG66_05385 [Clostridiales bacterium]|nr:hypothetical protein [Clostridiales bacterium]